MGGGCQEVEAHGANQGLRLQFMNVAAELALPNGIGKTSDIGKVNFAATSGDGHRVIR